MDRDLQKKFSDDIKEVSGGGVNMIYDLVGGDYAEPALRTIARHGKYLVIGFTAGIPKMPLNLTLLKECQILGVFWGQFAAVEHEENAQNFKELFEKSGVTFGSISEPYDHINDQQIADNEFFTKFTDKEDL